MVFLRLPLKVINLTDTENLDVIIFQSLSTDAVDFQKVSKSFGEDKIKYFLLLRTLKAQKIRKTLGKFCDIVIF